MPAIQGEVHAQSTMAVEFGRGIEDGKQQARSGTGRPTGAPRIPLQ